MPSFKSISQDHPLLLGVLILSGVFIAAWIAITVFLNILPGARKAEAFTTGSGKIGVVEVKGLISSSEKVLKELTSFRKNKHIRAIILRIDSPGGAVGASQEIFEEVRKANRTKPVIASMGSVAASGGYYAALGARKILANRGTLTGSIGVIVKFANLEEIFNKIGYRSEIIKSGKLKDIGAANRPMTVEEKKLLQGITDNIHNQFVEAVSKNRDIPLEKVKKLADGRIFSGEQALEAGLIDQFGNLNDAVMLAAKLSGIKDEFPVLVYPVENNFSLIKLLVGESSAALFKDLSLTRPLISYEWAVSP